MINQKIYKPVKTDNINIHPGNLQRLPDDYFYSFLNIIKGGLL